MGDAAMKITPRVLVSVSCLLFIPALEYCLLPRAHTPSAVNPCRIHFSRSILAKTRKGITAEELYRLTNDKQLKALMEESNTVVSDLHSLCKEIWGKIEPSRYPEFTFPDDDLLLQLRYKPQGGIAWLRENWYIVEGLRSIYRKHPCLNGMSIMTDDQWIMYCRKCKGGVVISFGMYVGSEYEVRWAELQIGDIGNRSIWMSQGRFFFGFSSQADYDPSSSVGPSFLIADVTDEITLLLKK